MPSAPSSLVVTPVTDKEAWDTAVLTAGGHPLQLWGWGELKSTGGHWQAHRLRVLAEDGTAVGHAQVLVRRLPPPFRALSYVPRGPVCADPARMSSVADAVAAWCRQHVGGLAVSFEPDLAADEPFAVRDGRPSGNTVLWPTTLIIDLGVPEDVTLAQMAKKTRQYIRKSAREDVEYRRVASQQELDACLEIYRETAERAGFALHSSEYYERVRSCMGEHAPIFAAFRDGRPIAFLWLATSDRTAFELYGGMNDEGQRLRANYALKWHAMTAVRESGVTRYDLNGLLNDGISTFKRGFAQHEDQLVGTVDVPFSIWYPVWDKALPRAKRVLRRLHR